MVSSLTLPHSLPIPALTSAMFHLIFVPWPSTVLNIICLIQRHSFLLAEILADRSQMSHLYYLLILLKLGRKWKVANLCMIPLSCFHVFLWTGLLPITVFPTIKAFKYIPLNYKSTIRILNQVEKIKRLKNIIRG